jgi:hypothetical protein
MLMDDANGATNNIYSSWKETAGTPKMDGTLNIRYLDSFDNEELNHLKRLIEQQLDILNNKEMK